MQSKFSSGPKFDEQADIFAALPFMSKNIFRLFVHSSVRSFVYSFVRLFVRLFIHLFVRLFVPSFVRSLVSSFVHSFVVCKAK